MTASTSRLDRAYRRLRAWIEYAPNADLHSLRMPTLAIYGAQDPLTPVQASVHRIAQLAPTVRSQVFLGVDHRLCINSLAEPSPAVARADRLDLGMRFPLCAPKANKSLASAFVICGPLDATIAVATSQ